MSSWKGRYYRGLLAARFALLNLAITGGLVSAWLKGYIQMAIAADTSYISHAIAVGVVAGVLVAGLRAWQIGSALDNLVTGVGWDTPLPHKGHVARLKDRIAPLRWWAGTAAFAGLIGTVVGFLVALSGVNENSIADVNAVGGVVAHLIEGMHIALYTTLVGALGGLWLEANVRLLEGGVARLERAIEWGE